MPYVLFHHFKVNKQNKRVFSQKGSLKATPAYLFKIYILRKLEKMGFKRHRYLV